MKKVILTTLIFSGIVAGLILFTNLGEMRATNKGAEISILSAEREYHDFGVISMSNGTVSTEIRIKNTTENYETITKLYTSCMCTLATIGTKRQSVGPYSMPGHGRIPRLSLDLEPAEEFTLYVSFDPAAHGPAGIGVVQRSVTIETNSGSPLVLAFRATVKP